MNTGERPEVEGQRLALKSHHVLGIGALVLLGILLALLMWLVIAALLPKPQQITFTPLSTEKPTISTDIVVSGYDHIWDIAFLPTKEMLFTERGGTLHLLQNNKVYDYPVIADVYATSNGEPGLMGLAVDPNFAQNRSIYTCFDSKNAAGDIADVRVVRWQLSADLHQLANRADLITGMPVSNGRHSGCRVQFGPDGYLYVGTGDSATGGIPQDHKSLGGKVLRVDRDGKPAPGNLGGDFDPRIYSYGHRNIQGLAFFPQSRGALGVTVEHGSSLDDEVNLLLPGNFGWNPPAGPYTELGVKMTDKTAIPDAIEAVWSSGDPTIAPSGATFLNGAQWKVWNGALAMAVLKGQHLKIITISKENKVTNTEDLLKGQFGRLRASVQGPDGNLYLSTDNGKTDQIIRVTPH